MHRIRCASRRGDACKPLEADSRSRHLPPLLDAPDELFQLRQRDRALQLGQPIIEREKVVIWVGSPYPQALLTNSRMRRARWGSSVTHNPPSPVVMCLPCCRLKQPISPCVPTSLPPSRARYAWSAPEHRQAALAGEIDDRTHLARIAEQMRDDDRLRLLAQACGDGTGRDVAGERIDVGEHRNSPW